MANAKPFLRWAVVLLALVCLAVGGVRSHKVFEGDGDFVVMVFERIPEYQLVEFATYGGVYADEEGKLVRYEWAMQQDGKQKCPT
ncbi:MAG TPA: hypothetical protein DCM68_03345 [Verrucomicrobia bacterium]|nr:hypothetical protein [Verrucomicrobiota bacterium]